MEQFRQLGRWMTYGTENNIGDIEMFYAFLKSQRAQNLRFQTRRFIEVNCFSIINTAF
jgi:hypothetical protein